MISERQQVTKKYWDEDDHSYLYRIDILSQRRIFWCNWSGERPIWVIQEIDNEGNQIGDAKFAANRRCLSTKETT